MTFSNEILDRAEAQRKTFMRYRKFEKTAYRFFKILLSFFIPFGIAFLITVFGFILFQYTHGNSFGSSYIYFCCKSFFPCLPFQIFFMTR